MSDNPSRHDHILAHAKKPGPVAHGLQTITHSMRVVMASDGRLYLRDKSGGLQRMDTLGAQDYLTLESQEKIKTLPQFAEYRAVSEPPEN